MQALFASDLSILDIDVGWPGAVHDNRVFENSSLAALLQQGLLDRNHIHFGNSTIPFYIFADAGYRQSKHVITPVKNDHKLTSLEESFDFYHSSTRMPA